MNENKETKETYKRFCEIHKDMKDLFAFIEEMEKQIEILEKEKNIYEKR